MEIYDDDDPIYGYIKQAFNELIGKGEIDLHRIIDEHVEGLSIELEPEDTYYNDKIHIIPVLQYRGRELYRGNRLEIRVEAPPASMCEVEDPEQGRVLKGHVYGQGVSIKVKNMY